MKEIMIIGGAYGHRAAGSPFVHTVARGEVCVVSDQEAERLVSFGVAKILNESTPVVSESVESVEEEQDIDLSAMSFNQLKSMASEMGIIGLNKLNSKQKLIDAILDSENEEAPELAAEGLVE